ncbi:hypothetical protein [Ruegeria lacuscaerulensis]|uniref:hypothetical protein n=1 Tax=Ruegeria lacuscaerulensis TaxID=55218 RepID=UPI00147A699E|nr:hypothetical protein [Ruegeria lacuscaerulensis]
MKCHLDWAECSVAFAADGTLRDIYVLGTTEADWQKFTDFAAKLDSSFYCDGEQRKLPKHISSIFDSNREQLVLMKIETGCTTIHCHFFTESELELDDDPKHIVSQQGLNEISEFIIGLGKVLKKNVVLTEENAPAAVWLSYSAADKKIAFRHP